MTTRPPITRLANRELEQGLAVAQLLRQVDSPQSPVARQQLLTNDLVSLLCSSGVGALAWSVISKSELAKTPAGLELHDAYRRQRLSARRHERDIETVISQLRAAGVEPVLVKGWAIARHYADPALRPYGDIDLCVSPNQFANASEVLKEIESIDGPFVDLHSGFNGIGVGKRLFAPSLRNAQREWDELYSRTRLVALCNVQRQTTNVNGTNKVPGPSALDIGQSLPVRVLSDEDHLRVLCVHMLRSGARRPTWLCDVAVMLSPKSSKASPKSNVQSPQSSFGAQTLDIGPWILDSKRPFDWTLALGDGDDPVHANYVATSVQLAHELLGANVSQTPFAGTRAPRWIVAEVLKQWGGGSVQSSMSKVKSPGVERRFWPLDFGHWTNLYRRWNNPIRATAAVGGTFTEKPRLRHRISELIARLPEVPNQLREFQLARKRHRAPARLVADLRNQTIY
ncbi:MAG TPA: nucleotidyltransferase family protein [Pyrinomonadaceae bacterium]|nr:nucleotidyltransferase family protein [Pyrinomonadaceae bacterium]